MIPRTYPSQTDSTGRRRMVVKFLTSTSGLTRWTDYVPVAFTQQPSLRENSTDFSGYIAVVTPSAGYSSLVAGTDYVNVYVETYTQAGAWQVSATGFIPVEWGGSEDVSSLFPSSSTAGAWYGPYDLSTVYQDSAGTTAGAVGQPMGLILDKRLGAVRGAELAPTTTSTTGWTPTNATLSASASGLTITNSGAAEGLAKIDGYATVVGLSYEVLYDIVESTAASGNKGAMIVGGTRVSLGTAAGTGKRQIIKAGDTSGISFGTNSTTAGQLLTVANVSAKELPGNHASQSNSPSRPTLSGRYNGLVATEDFSNAAWTKANTATVTGTNTVNLPAEGDYVSQVWTRAVAVGEAFTGRMTLSGTGTIALRIARSGSGTYEEKITTPITLTATPTSHPVTHTFANAQTGVRLDIIRSATTATSVTATQADLRTSADASLAIPAYQRVTTATDYDTAGFPLGSEFDGTDDSLTASAGGGGTTGFFFCAAVRVAGGAGTVRDIWSDEGTNAGHIVRIGSTDVLVFGVGNGSAFTFATSGASLPVGETHVITVWDDGTNLRVQVDNGGVNNAARPAAVAGTSSFTVGKQNGAAARFFNGRIFSPIYRHGTPVTASSRERIKRYVAARAGVTL